MKKKITQVKTLLEAIPYIKKYSGEIFVIKYGGSAQINPTLKDKFAQDILLLYLMGIKVVIVHGGGKKINSTLDKMRIKSEFVDGMRVTDKNVMEVVEMVLAGNINKEITTLLNNHGAKALGITGKDANFIKAIPKNGGKYGFVGEITNIDNSVIENLLNENFIPVIAPIASSNEPNHIGFNINADLAASKIAGSLKARKIIFLTDIVGVLDKDKNLLATLTEKQIKNYKKDGTIFGGMIPKVDACLEAVNLGVAKTHIIDGRVEHSILLEVFTDEGIGTLIRKERVYPTFIKNYNSLMAKYLTKKVFNNLKNLTTKKGYTLENVINSGIKNPDSGIGVYAGDKESYKIFRKLFDPIIKDYHNFSKKIKHKTNLNPEDLKWQNPDPKNEYIISTRIRVGRNLDNIPLGTAISKTQRDEVEKIVSEALMKLPKELSGKYYPLKGLSQEDKNSLISSHFLFKEGDRFLKYAGLNRDWAEGRGIFHNHNKTFLVWINEEDQLRIISMQKGGDIKEVFARLSLAIKELEKKMKFSFDKYLGYITSCPTNLGTAMRASVHIKLPKLGAKMEKFKTITDKYHLQIRGIHGEHSKSENGIYDISNKRRLGVTEVECVQDMINGVEALIKKEKELS